MFGKLPPDDCLTEFKLIVPLCVRVIGDKPNRITITEVKEEKESVKMILSSIREAERLNEPVRIDCAPGKEFVTRVRGKNIYLEPLNADIRLDGITYSGLYPITKEILESIEVKKSIHETPVMPEESSLRGWMVLVMRGLTSCTIGYKFVDEFTVMRGDYKMDFAKALGVSFAEIKRCVSCNEYVKISGSPDEKFTVRAKDGFLELVIAE